MKTSKMQKSLDKVLLNFYGAQVHWGMENRVTWLEVIGEITPHDYERLSQLIADTTGRSFYFNQIGIGYMQGALDAQIHDDESGEELKVPDYYTKQDWRTPLSEYGFEFKPKEEH